MTKQGALNGHVSCSKIQIQPVIAFSQCSAFSDLGSGIIWCQVVLIVGGILQLVSD